MSSRMSCTPSPGWKMVSEEGKQQADVLRMISVHSKGTGKNTLYYKDNTNMNVKGLWGGGKSPHQADGVATSGEGAGTWAWGNGIKEFISFIYIFTGSVHMYYLCN